MKKILIGCCVAFLSSCSLIHLLSVDANTSESMSQSNEYLSKHQLDTLFSYQICSNYIDSLSAGNYTINAYKLKIGTAASPLQLRMYNSKGEFLYGWEQCFGDIDKLGVLDSIPFKKVKHLPVNFNLSLNRDLSIVNIKNRELLEQEILKHDYIILLYWAKWGGWFNRDLMTKTKKYLRKYNKKHSILFISINTAP